MASITRSIGSFIPRYRRRSLGSHRPATRLATLRQRKLMIKRSEVRKAQERAATMLERLGVKLTANERANIEVAEFGLGELERTGLELVVYVNNDRYCA